MRKLSIFILLVALAGFLAALGHLLRLRFETGDNYPPYSSFRADPIGTKAFYESVDALASARRSLQPILKLGDGRDTTLLWLGATPEALRFHLDEFRVLETFVRSGGRLIIAASPAFESPRTNIFALAAARKRGVGGAAPTNAPSGVADDFLKVYLTDRWDVSFDYKRLARREPDGFDPVAASLQITGESSGLPSKIFVHSALTFEPRDPAWHEIYTRREGTNAWPVLIQRFMGRGSIVLLVDSFYFSNEALRDDRQPGFLSWAIGPGRRVVFEETHLGTTEKSGVVTLARKYHLESLLIALVLLALLFIWKNATSLMPARERQKSAETGDTVEGRDSAGAFVNLLRRNVAPANLLRVCLDQWNLALGAVRKPARHQLEEMQRIIDAENAAPPRQRNPVMAYREFCRILSRDAGARRPVLDAGISNRPGPVSPPASETARHEPETVPLKP
ncbi:MAG: hypothetical protein QOF48_16 [Verrucomicrobiota bacterium]